MRLYDFDADRVYTLPDLKREYLIFKAEDPENVGPTFSRYLFDVIDACNRGRNNCDVVGMTARELGKMQSYLAYRIRFDDL